MDELVGKRYGTALFEVALENHMLDQMEEDIKIVLQMINNNPEFIQVLLLPNVMYDEKIKIVKEAFEGKINKELMGLLVLTLEKSRQDQLEKILHYALEAIYEEKGILTAYITSASSLSEVEKEQIREKLSEQTKKQIQLNCKTDESLIGGIIIRIKDRVLDHTIKGDLHLIAKKLYAVEING